MYAKKHQSLCSVEDENYFFLKIMACYQWFPPKKGYGVELRSCATVRTKSQVRARTTQMTVTVGWGTRMLCSFKFNCLTEKLWKLGKLQQSEGEATAIACNHKCMATDD